MAKAQRSRAKSTRSPAQKATQSDYESRKRAEGLHVQWNMRLKTEADIALAQQLQARFRDMTMPAITRLALRELGARENKR